MSSIIVLDSSDEDETPAKKKIAFPRINSATTITVVNKQNTVPSDSTNQSNSQLNRKTTFVKNNTLISKMLLGPDVTTTMAKPKASTLPNMNAGYTIKPATKAPNTSSPTKIPTTPTSVSTFTPATSNIQQIQPKLRQIQPKPQMQQQKTQQPLQQLQQKVQQQQLQKLQQLQMQKPMQMQVQKPQQLQFQKPQEPQVKKSQQLQFQRPQEPPAPKPAQPQSQWAAQQLQMQKPMQLQVQKPQQQQIRKPQEPPASKPGQPQLQKPQQQQIRKPQEPPTSKAGQPQLQKPQQLQVQKPQQPKVQKTQMQKSQQLFVQTPQQVQLQKQQQSQKLQKIQLQKQQQHLQLQHQIQQHQQTMQHDQQQQKQQLQPKQQTMQHEQQQQKQQLQPKQQEIMQQQKKKQLQQQKQQQQNFEQQIIQQQQLQTQQIINQQHRTAQQNHNELLQQQIQQIQQMKQQLPQNQQLQPHQPMQQQQKPKPNPRKRKIPTPPVPVSLTAAPTPEQACNMLFPSLMMMMNSSGTMMPMIQSVHSMGDMPSAMPPLQLLSTPVPPPPPPIIPTTTIETSPFGYSCQPPTVSRSLSPVMKNHNDNFKIHLPLKQPNYITCSPLATTATTSTSTASALRSIKRIKPTTLLKNNDAAWLQRQQTKPPSHLMSSSSTPFSMHDNEFLRTHLATPATSSVLPASSSTAQQQGYGGSTPVSRWVPGQQRSPTTITPAISSITTPTSSRSVTPKTTPVKAPVTPTMRSQTLKDYLDKPPAPIIRVVYKTTPKTITQTPTLSRLTPTLGTPQQATKSPPVFDLTKSPEKPKIYTKPVKLTSPASTLPAVTTASTSSSLNPRVVNTLNENGTATSLNSTSTVESSSETSTATADQPRLPFIPEFESLLNVCRKADPSDDMDALIKKKLTRYYYSVDPGFVHSDGFRKQLQSTIERIKGDPQLVYYNLKGIVEELKVRCLNTPKTVCPEPVGTSEIAVETTSTGNEHTDEQIRQLNKALSLVRKRIEQLEQSEVDWDDDDSSYLQVERFQKRACQIFEKICELTGESKSTISQVRKPIKFTGTTYPQFNRTLSAYVNQTNEFPDYFDVLRVLEHCNSTYSLGLAQFEMKHIAEDAFIKVGKSLQARRKTDLYETAAHYTANAKDPATADPILLAKLSENQKHKKKISDVLEKYAREQDMNAEEIRLKKAATVAANSGANADAAKALPIVENGKYNKTDAVVAKIVKESKDYGIDDVDNDDDDEDDEEEDEEEDDDDDDVEIVGVVENMSITEITDDDDDDDDDDDEDEGDGDGDNNDDDDVEFVAADEDEKKSDDLKEKSETKLDKLETKNITVVCNNITTFTTTKTTTITTTNTSKTTVTKTATQTPTPIIVNKDNLTAKSSPSHSSDRNGNVLVKNSQTEQQQAKPNNHSNNNNNIKPNFFSLVHGDRPNNNLLSLRLDKSKTTPASVTASVTGSVTASVTASSTSTSTSTATATTTSINYKPLQQQLQQKQIMINGKMTNVKRVTLVPPPPASQCNAAPATTLRISSVASLNSSICKTSPILNTKPLSSGAAAVPFKPRIFPDIVISDEES